MRKLLISFLCLFVANFSNATIIMGEDSNDRFLYVKEVQNGVSFYECSVGNLEENCSPLFGSEVVFSRAELEELARWNSFKAAGTVVADVGVIVVGTVLSIYMGLGIAATFTTYKGAEVAAYMTPYLIGGGATSVGSTFLLDSLDPFVHSDISTAFQVANQTYDSDLTDSATDEEVEDILSSVEGYRAEDGQYVVVLEDLNFEELRERIGSQLADKKDIELPGLIKEQKEEPHWRKYTPDNLY